MKPPLGPPLLSLHLCGLSYTTLYRGVKLSRVVQIAYLLGSAAEMV